MANNGLSGRVAVTSALHLTADVRAPMSVFTPISSALHLGADLHVARAGLPLLTHSRHGVTVPSVAYFRIPGG